ncbi:helix-turn-helix domain-containing protein [Thiomicrorhabdus sp. ZW0627]|uniref:helix-turn-helix domain-containing protein n=1 Tax=Thiomicrorhabdus sp. ZW0627 TaxID=3039774 RepID=UPI002436CA9B|nr:helix-turn-helix domain-containing protein [Thiomicrorhabdus sp. ZW0627]MDG6774879.1 helix-turn-helix domain-containing protein [Thiomicrorhabdus sp. ZW0627]
MTKPIPNHSLSEQVTLTLEHYFETLQEESACDLYEMVIQQIEKPLIEFVLDKTEQNQSRSAQILGINRNTLRKKMQKYDLI